MACVRADLTVRGGRSVVIAHAWVAGGNESDSERDIAVGGVGRVPASLFDGIDYTALGHLHGPQELRRGLRYSGSPLAYSFSEAHHRKGSWLVELGPRGLVGVVQVPAPVPRPLSVLQGRLPDLLAGPVAAGQQDHWLRVVLTDPVRPEDAMERLRARFPHVLVLDWQPEGAGLDERTYGARVAGRDDLDVAEEFVRHVRGAGSPQGAVDAGERALLRQAFEAGRLAEASA